ncbi:hypothetical protein GCM10007147_40040 [Nocardiopsis kunsanensis]|uniref:Lanthionine biosynthesis cyclase LanC n=1 Tax=Nocardiopsis kunsanensis TaxID=141693 RepID=A0A918XJ11_9ACTN|nr:lanthionine synthetase C family protein [Nocardiopsis kunsanensis]GHD34439.1 hypothetical protein GCM10007147_40040 [Nocardiopsis kunsanensis]
MTSTDVEHASAVAAHIAERLATPEQARYWAGDSWWPQSLAHGALGVGLLHIERARTGEGPWERAQTWLECAVAEGVDASPAAHLYYGAPALAFVLERAHQVRPSSGPDHERLQTAVTHLVRDRVGEAEHARAARGLPVLAEFDTIRGLSGLGALLLDGSGSTPLVRRVLSYLVSVTEPADVDGVQVPGWWAPVGPASTEDPAFAGGHANTGIAHGICGPLILLSRALVRGIEVPGQVEAIDRILAWLDRWEQTGAEGTWWPYWVTLEHLRGESLRGPQRPSWCYGAAGVAYAQSVAASALGDEDRSRAADQVLTRVLTRLPQEQEIVDHSLCHGQAGLAILARASGHSAPPPLFPELAHAAPEVAAEKLLATSGIGLLEGAAGTGLALHTLSRSSSVGWAGFLLLEDEEHDRAA